MRRHTIPIGVLALLVGIFVQVVGARQRGFKARTLTRQALEDKIRGGWAGQMIGVSFGVVSTGPERDETILMSDSPLMRWYPGLRGSIPPR